jgi:uncharacterized protein YjbI with pentapeptide repeats
VQIVGAWFDDYIDLVGGMWSHPLFLNGSRFTRGMDFSWVRAASVISLDGSAVAGKVTMYSTEIEGSLLMSKDSPAQFADLDLNSAKIGGDLALIGVKITGTLTMDSTVIGDSLFMAGSKESAAQFADVNLAYAKIGGQLDLDRAEVSGKLDMDSTVIGAELLMSGSTESPAQFGDVNLHSAKIASQFNLNGAKITGKLEMDSTAIGGDLYMVGTATSPAEFGDVHLPGAKIGGELALLDAKVTGTLDLESAVIGGDLYMVGTASPAELGDVHLPGAKIGGKLDLNGAKVAGRLDMDSAVIGGNLLMSKILLTQKANLVFITVKGNLDISGASLAGLDLTGARIAKEMILGSPTDHPTWDDDASLVLRDTQVDALQDAPAAWPEHVDLEGFTYGRLGGLRDPKVDVSARGSQWFIHWLAKDEPYSPQPYEQIAAVLRTMGHDEEANDVLFAGAERARQRACDNQDIGSWLGQTLLKWTVGYGYGRGPFRALYWVVGFVAVGWIVLWLTGQRHVSKDADHPSMTLGLVYSLDMLLPIVRLREAHYNVELVGIARYYFYCHRLMGFVLGSFLVAGISGLTH